MSTTFAEVEDEYKHIICQAEHRGLCGMQQEEIAWFTVPCSVCHMIAELQPANTCPLRGGVCTCIHREAEKR